MPPTAPEQPLRSVTSSVSGRANGRWPRRGATSAPTGVADTAGGPVIEHTGFRLSWGAIFAGLIVAMVTQIVLSVLGLAIGLTVWDPGDAAGSLAQGAGIWMAVAALVSLFIGGLVTGHLAGVLTVGDGALHGGIMWGLSMVVTLWLTASGAGMILGGAFQVVGTAAGAGYDLAGRDAAGVALEAGVRGDREAVVQGIAERTGLTRQEADRLVSDVEGMATGVEVEESQVRQTAEQVTAGVGSAAWWALLALLLSAAAAAGGAAITSKH
jgi:hypothetical protein